MSYSYFVIFVLYLICILFYLHSVTFAFFYNCILSYLHFVIIPLCTICIQSHSGQFQYFFPNCFLRQRKKSHRNIKKNFGVFSLSSLIYFSLHKILGWCSYVTSKVKELQNIECATTYQMTLLLWALSSSPDHKKKSLNLFRV